jgi:hypothetical protein
MRVREVLSAARTALQIHRTAVGASPSSRSAIFSQRCRQVFEIPKSLATWATDASLLRATAITSRRNSAGYGLGTMLILPARPEPHRQGFN